MKWTFHLRLTAVLAFAVGSVLEAQVEQLEELLDGYRAVHAVHLEARAVVSLAGRDDRVAGEASFEYWESGRRYRARCHADERLRRADRFPLAQDADFAYDGKLAQHWDREQNLLSIGRRESRLLPLALPNPFVLPVAFLLPDARDCRGCKIGLSEIHTLSLDAVAEAGQLYWQGAGDETIRIERTPFGGRPVDVEVTLAEVDGTPVARRIVRSHETTRQVVELFDHQPVGDEGRATPFLFPRRIVLSDYGAGPDGEEELRIRTEYAISTLEIDRKIPRSRFRIRGDRTTAIYDREQRRFLRRPGAEEDAAPLPGIRLDRRDD